MRHILICPDDILHHVLRLADWRAELGDTAADGVSQAVMDRFLRPLGAAGSSPAEKERG